MRNTLEDLNNHLFEQLERLGEEDLSEEQLEKEIKRTDAITKIATNIVQNGALVFKVYEHCGPQDIRAPKMLVGYHGIEKKE